MLTSALAGAGPATAAVRPPTPSDRIAAGVSVAGIAVGGLTIGEAADLLEGKLAALALRPVVVRAGDRTFRLSPARARLVFDPERSAKRAYYAGAEQSSQGSSADSSGIDVPAAIEYSRVATRAWAAAVGRHVNRRARSASLRVGVRKLTLRRARTGRRIDTAALAGRIEGLFADPRSNRHVTQRVARTSPAVTSAELRRRYPVVLTVDRHQFKLRLFKRLRLSRTYGIALGAAGYDTPAGLFRITQRIVNPPWHAPNKPWAGAYAGRTVPGGAPDNPLKARWLGIRDGVGIHGTAQEWSIGTRASHGCIRMRVADVVRLYDQVPLGAPIRISR
jgi:L,D-transpeptidase catalytic domain